MRALKSCASHPFYRNGVLQHITERVCGRTPTVLWHSRFVGYVATAVGVSSFGSPLQRSSQRSVGGASSSTSNLLSHCKLIQSILDNSENNAAKRRRVNGVVRKMESNLTAWMAEEMSSGAVLPSVSTCSTFLLTLSSASLYLPRKDESLRRQAFIGPSGLPARQSRRGDDWCSDTPFFSASMSDTLCLCLDAAASEAGSFDERMRLLDAAVQLELMDADVLQKLCHQLTMREETAKRSSEDLVHLLRSLSLAVKRCKLPPPPLGNILSHVSQACLSSHDSLTVLSSLVRLKDRRGGEVGEGISRRALPYVPTYTVRDVVYGLEAVALLNTCNEAYAGALLDRCAEVAPKMLARELGDVTKYVALLNASRRNNTIAGSCAKELRRALPALVERAEKLLGTFSLRDARCVLRCFTQHKLVKGKVETTQFQQVSCVDSRCMHSEPECVGHDELWDRLHNSYTQQRSRQLSLQKAELDNCYAAQSVKHCELTTSVDLLSDDVALMLNELEAICLHHKLARGIQLVHGIRAAANRDLRESLSHIESGYTSAFERLLQENEHEKHKTHARPEVPETHSSTRGRVGGKKLKMSDCPSSWKITEKTEVIDEMAHQSTIVRSKLNAKSISLREGLSATTGMFAESLAVLLQCGAVRIYLYDDLRNLHCCASYPYHATEGDPLRATHTELMLAKELHQTVCTKLIAVNGSSPRSAQLSEREVEAIQNELQASGLHTMKTCLIFPIISLSGAHPSLGMVHAVNKVSVSQHEPTQFSLDDEVLMSMMARMLGCILSRYPIEYFTMRVGEAVRRAVGPTDYDDSDPLPRRLVDEVEEAAEVGNKAMTLHQGVMIYRAPLNDIYQTRTHRTRARKLESLHTKDSTLSSVEFNVNSITQLWESSMTENVQMHQQYRTLSMQFDSLRLLLRNLLDGLATTRTIRDARSMASYLQTLELLARSENNIELTKFIGETLLDATCGSAALSRGGAVGQCSPDTMAGTVCRDELGADTDPPAVFSESMASPFLTEADARVLVNHHRRINAAVASNIHSDGPDCIRLYTSDPASKRAQARFIDEMTRESAASHHLDCPRGRGQYPVTKRGVYSTLPNPKELPTLTQWRSTKTTVSPASKKRPFLL